MKLIHCADLHLDSRMMTNLSREQAKTRKMEILRTFTRMVEFAAENQVRAILISGDLFDTRNISATVRNQVRDMIQLHPDIDFLYLRGNHDDDNFLARLEEIPDNLLLFGSDWISYEYGSIVISGMEISRENQATMAGSLLLEPEKFNIVMLHGQTTPYENKQDPLNIPLRSFRNKHIDYMALGHVHEYTFGQLDPRGYYGYPGCLEGRGFDECDEHGFILVEIDDRTRKPSYSFVPIAYRTLYTLPVDVTGITTTQEAASRIEQVLSQGDYSSRSLVKFVLTGDVTADCDINIRFLEEQFAEYFYFEKIVDQTKLQISYSDFEKDASLKGEFIRMVLESELDEEKKNEIIRCGIGLLAGEEI